MYYPISPRIYKTLWFSCLAFMLLFTSRAFAESQIVHLQLYSLNQTHQFNPNQPTSISNLKKTDKFSLVGGHYLYAGGLNIDKDGAYVIDFKNTTVIDHFDFYIYNQQNQLIASAKGGIGSKAPNPFFLRHGRTFDLKAGQYTLFAEFSSPYYIAQPVPFVSPLAQYQHDIKLGNAIVLVGLGIFLALGIYYGALSFASTRNTELMYAIFIFSNLIFNAGAHLVLSQLFGIHNTYMISFPILISNFFYVMFVMRLLEIHPVNNKKLHGFGVILLVLIAGFGLFGIAAPNWINEMARFGVWAFLLYGLVAGITRIIQGSIVARLYLLALAAFISLASMATLPTNLNSNTIDVEHYGLAAIAVEAILLALLLTYRVGELYRERMNILNHLQHSKKLANTDALTQIPNRYAMEVQLSSLGTHASLTYIDMDNLKYYNDRFGHAKGDELLTRFANMMHESMDGHGRVFRVGGDEFAVICGQGDVKRVQGIMSRVVDEMKRTGFDSVGVSSGTAFMHEVSNTSELKHLADIRMYENKFKRKKAT